MEKHLWKNVHDLSSVRKRAVQTAKMLKIVADDADSTAYEKQAAAAGIVCIREITSRLEKQNSQLEQLCAYMYERIGEEETLKIMVDCGIDRNELVSLWGIDHKKALKAQGGI